MDERPVHYRQPSGHMLHASHNLSSPPRSTTDPNAVTCTWCLEILTMPEDEKRAEDWTE